jgi:hypothetical protein
MLVLSFLLVGDMTWQMLMVPAAGVVVALAVLGAGFFFVNKRKAKTAAIDSVTDAEEPRPRRAPPAALQGLRPATDPFIQGGASELRQSPRRAGQSIRVSIQLVNDPKTVFDGYVMDRSMGGLRLQVDRSLNHNQMLNVRSTDAPESVGSIQVQVRRITQLPDKSYEIGCQFIRTPPWAVLLTFG